METLLTDQTQLENLQEHAYYVVFALRGKATLQKLVRLWGGIGKSK